MNEELVITDGTTNVLIIEAVNADSILMVTLNNEELYAEMAITAEEARSIINHLTEWINNQC